MITLLDYGAGNVRSVVNAIERLGYPVRTVTEARDIETASTLVFPGVGSFGAMVDSLRAKGWWEPLRAYLEADRPFLGICLGMQVLFAASEESPGVPGLGIFPGTVRRFATDLTVPHIGWNGIAARKASPLFCGLDGTERFYFVHSFYVDAADDQVVAATTDYGGAFVSAVQRGNVCATQFHPEKSGDAGLRVLRNFLAGAPAALPRSQTTGLAKRIIACLDVRSNDEGDLVVTKGDQYDVREEGRVRNLGAPVALARRYYEEGADEITFLNITGFRDFPLTDLPMLDVLRETSKEVFVPLTIGGGIRDYTDADGRTYTALEVANAYFRAGADKVSIGSDAVYAVRAYLESGVKTGRSPIETISGVYGAQAVVVSIDPRRVYLDTPDDAPPGAHVVEALVPDAAGRTHCWYECTVKGGREGSGIDAVTLARCVEELGAGEILLNCIDQDGTNSGFDIPLITAVKRAVTIPVIASSGAGCVEHFSQVFSATGADAALAAGIFHRREVPIAAVKRHLDGAVPVRLTP